MYLFVGDNDGDERAVDPGGGVQTNISENSGRAYKILVALDGSAVLDKSLVQAVALTRTLNAELHAIIVQKRRPAFETIAMEVEIPQPMVDRYFAEVVYQIKRTAEEAGSRIESVKVVKGIPADAILRHIREVGFDFVVLGRRQGGRRFSFLAGSTVRKVVARSPCTTIVVPK